jgi:putative membrane-bound dehydrogenase-like protein
MTHLWTRLPSKIVRSKRGRQIGPAIWAVLIAIASSAPAPAGDGNRFAYLDGGTPYYPSRAFPKLATPQWVGEPGVEAVVVLAIDDMREPKKYETFLRPILQRLKQIDGRAGLSIMTCRVKPEDPQLKSWLDEGLSLEIHTVDHPCPLFKEGDFAKAKSTYDRCVDLLAKVPGNVPVAFRMPCCDGLNTVSPRFYAEIFSKTTPAGEFLQIDSSVFNLFTDDNPQSSNLGSEPRKSTGRFSKYIPSDHGFVNLIENYSYPYVIDRLCWEFPCAVPSDWEASHCHKSNNPLTVADWERALDLTVRNQGVMTMVFHPHGWIKNSQMVELIDYAVKTYGRKVKFLNFREALDRINKNLLAGNPLRDASGNDNGVRILDVNADGYLDVVVGNAQTRLTRIWKPKTRTWSTTGFPCGLDPAAAGRAGSFAVFDGPITSVVGEAGGERPDQRRMGGWDFNGQDWVPARWFPPLSQFLRTVPVTTSVVSRAPGSRLLFRDLNGDGRCEAIVGDSKQTSIFYLTGNSTEPVWNKAKFTLPPETAIPNPLGSESGLRFEDVDGDGDLDVLFSNADRYSLHLFDSMETGWSRRILADRRGSRQDGDELPMIARADATNNGAWFRDGHLWVQNEETDKWKNLVAQRSADDWLKDVSIGPLTPERSLQAIRVHPGFTVELVAAEPLVVSPVAFEWGADGKLWVAEMVDYPLGIDGKGKPGGAVVVLEDTDGDGRYDKRTVFANQLNLPNGILPWGKGVLVTAAPDIIYLADTDGDGVADKREVLYTGFRQGNPQHRPNGLVRGLDNWIYCANGGESGGMILSTKTGKTTNVGRRDFRIRPETGEIETEFGTTQFLRSRDDWGDWFGNHNSDPMWQYVLEERSLRRNPLAFAAEVRHDVSVHPGPSRVYPISHTEKRFNDFSMQNHFTSACSAIVYGDELFGPEFEGNTFVSEPVHNLIHREVARRDGILFRSERSKDEQQSEFLASRDNWFRPTMLKVGPDGALYFADVYRKVIEHPQYIPKELHARLDFRAGVDRGRLYRVFPRGKRLRPTPKLAASSSLDLVAALDSPNRWQRDTAQKLLIERNDPTAISPLTSLAAKAKLPQGRVQALWTLEDLNALPAGLVTNALSDGHWGVRKNAVRLAEPFLGKDAAIQEAVLRRVDDADAAVQLQTAYALGEWRDGRSADALGRLALRHADDLYFLTGVLSSLDRKNIDQILAQILSDPRANVPESLMKRLLDAAVMLKSDRALATALSTVTRPEALQTDRAATFLRLAAIWHALSRMGTSFDRLETEATPEIRSAIRRIDAVLADARNQLNDPNAPEGLRIAAVKILGLRERDVPRDIAALAVTLVPQNSAVLQIAAVDRLGELKGDEVPGLLLRGWKSHRPAIRDRIVEILLRRNYWRRVFLDAVEKRSVGAGEVEMVRWQEIVRSSEPAQQKRAEKILAGLIDPNRQKAVQQFRSALTLTGNAGRGKPLFVKHCATCHKLGDAGQNVGPDLASRKDKSPESLLIAVLDPNRNVEPKYVAYVAVTTGGRTYNGILADESANGLVLIGAKGDRVELLRSQIEELTSTSKSLMPEGLEKDLSPQAVADVIAYIQAFDSPAPRR